MDKAFVLINCKPGKESYILEQLSGMKNVVNAQKTFGAYDIIAKIESDVQSHLDNIITDQIRKLNEVYATLTLIPTESDDMSDLHEIVSDVIPEQKKPLEEHSLESEDDNLDDECEEDYDDSTKLN